MYVIGFLVPAQDLLLRAAPDMPPQLWWMTACVFFILALTATIDAFTAEVPDPLIFLGLVAVIGVQSIEKPWQVAAFQLLHAIEAGLLIWAVNHVWYRLFKADALGMGDAKWTMLAVACFGVMPSVIAWGVGAVLGVIVIAAAWLVHRRLIPLTFAPFLLIGLSLGLYWLRIKPV